MWKNLIPGNLHLIDIGSKPNTRCTCSPIAILGTRYQSAQHRIDFSQPMGLLMRLPQALGWTAYSVFKEVIGVVPDHSRVCTPISWQIFGVEVFVRPPPEIWGDSAITPAVRFTAANSDRSSRLIAISPRLAPVEYSAFPAI